MSSLAFAWVCVTAIKNNVARVSVDMFFVTGLVDIATMFLIVCAVRGWPS